MNPDKNNIDTSGLEKFPTPGQNEKEIQVESSPPFDSGRKPKSEEYPEPVFEDERNQMLTFDRMFQKCDLVEVDGKGEGGAGGVMSLANNGKGEGEKSSMSKLKKTDVIFPPMVMNKKLSSKFQLVSPKRQII